MPVRIAVPPKPRRLRTKGLELSLAWNECEALRVCPQLSRLCMTRLINPHTRPLVFALNPASLRELLGRDVEEQGGRSQETC